MRCLIDADVLVYEIGFSAQFNDSETGDLVVLDFDFAADLLAQRIKEIEEECWADDPSTLYLTNDTTLHSIWSRYRKTQGLKPVEYKENFRKAIAVSKPYKGNRKTAKPFHRDNLRAHMLSTYDTLVANGMEADDLICIDAKDDPNVTICTRDKDLRMVQGRHYGWPCGKQPQFGPMVVEGVGHIDLVKKDVKGWGMKFFYSQLITGDTVDNIPGLPKGGPALAYKLLADLEDEPSMYEAVTAKYKEKLGDEWEAYFEEQVNLLWMVQELDDRGEPVLWKQKTMNT